MKPSVNQAIDWLQAFIYPPVGLMQYTVKDGNGLRGYSLLKVRDLEPELPPPDSPGAQLARAILIALMYSEAEMPAQMRG